MIVNVAQIDPNGGVTENGVVAGASISLRDDDQTKSGFRFIIEFGGLSDGDHARSRVDLEHAFFIAGSETVLDVGRGTGRCTHLKNGENLKN